MRAEGLRPTGAVVAQLDADRWRAARSIEGCGARGRGHLAQYPASRNASKTRESLGFPREADPLIGDIAARMFGMALGNE